jgi:hypothetical protein
MTRRKSQQFGGRPGVDLVAVDGIAPDPEFDHDPLPDQILGIALDQRAFGPRQLMLAFAAYDGRFLALLWARRTDPVDVALEACLLHFDMLGRGGEAHAAAVVLCDEPVADGPIPPGFLARFEGARRLAQKYGVHLIDWIGCDDELFRCARLRTFAPATDPDWWDVPHLPTAS